MEGGIKKQLKKTIEKNNWKKKKTKNKNKKEAIQNPTDDLKHRYYISKFIASHKPLHYQRLITVHKQVYNNAGRQGNKKGNCLVGRRGVGWVSATLIDFLQAVAVRTPNVYFGAVFQLPNRPNQGLVPSEGMSECLDQGFEQLLSLPSSQWPFISRTAFWFLGLKPGLTRTRNIWWSYSGNVPKVRLSKAAAGFNIRRMEILKKRLGLILDDRKSIWDRCQCQTRQQAWQKQQQTTAWGNRCLFSRSNFQLRRYDTLRCFLTFL